MYKQFDIGLYIEYYNKFYRNFVRSARAQWKDCIVLEVTIIDRYSQGRFLSSQCRLCFNLFTKQGFYYLIQTYK